MKTIKVSLLILALGCFNNVLFAQGDGPRGYMPLPVGKNMVTPMYTHVESNQMLAENPYFKVGADFYTNIYSAMYTHVFDLAGHSAAAVGVLSYGSTSGYGEFKGNLAGYFDADLKSGKTDGFTDFYGIIGVNLYGAPSVKPGKAYLSTKYNFVANVLFSFKAPIGEYNKDKLINMGANRWELRFGFPMMKYLNWGTPTLTSFELLPSVSFFTNNNDVAGGNTLKEKPKFSLEGHITQSINQMLWVSLDAFYVTGGETAIDDADFSAYTNSFQLGGTIGASFSKQISTKITYGGVVAHNDNGMDGDMFRVCASYLF